MASGLPFFIAEGTFVHCVPPILDVPRSGVVTEVQEGNGGDMVVRFDTVTNKTHAGQLVGCHCLVSRELLDDAQAALAEGTLVGYTVRDCATDLTGTVEDWEEMPAQTLLSVRLHEDDRLVFIPLVEDFIVEFDAAEKLIVMDLPAGLLDL